MYFVLTTRCNMSCGHCVFAATKRGSDMSWDVFRRGIDLANKYNDNIFLGGGEPTLNDYFERMLLYALANNRSEIGLGIVTNGSIKERALLVAGLARQNLILADLSQDEYHDEIDDEVIEAFGKNIRTVKRLIPVGRAAKLKDVEFNNYEKCPCDELQVMPNGKIKQCRCRKAPLVGTVFDGFYGDPKFGMCYKSDQYIQEMQEI